MVIKTNFGCSKAKGAVGASLLGGAIVSEETIAMVDPVHGLLVTDERSPELNARGDATSSELAGLIGRSYNDSQSSGDGPRHNMHCVGMQNEMYTHLLRSAKTDLDLYCIAKILWGGTLQHKSTGFSKRGTSRN
jgi:hypothetical protein